MDVKGKHEPEPEPQARASGNGRRDIWLERSGRGENDGRASVNVDLTY